MFLYSTKSQIMVETMVALAMVIIAMLGMLALLSNSIGINRIVSDQHIATYLASEGVEIVKNVVDTNTLDSDTPFNKGFSNCSNGCRVSYDSLVGLNNGFNMPIKFEETTGIYSYNSGEDTPFVRLVRVNLIPANNELVVKSIVTWNTRGGIEEEIELEDHFIDWRK